MPAAESVAARAVRLLTRPRPLVTRFTRAHATVLKASRGRIRRSAVLGGGQPVLALTTVGRRSGTARSTVVAYLAHGESFAVFGMNLGSEHDPAWCLNLDARPRARIDMDGRRIDVLARRAEGPEAEALWARQVQRLPATERFATLAGRPIPVFVLDPMPR